MQCTNVRLIWEAPELRFLQKVKASGVYSVVKLVQISEFLRVLVFRRKALG